jgi:pimeloyl-ACP methyl ester carboxylesterase
MHVLALATLATSAISLAACSGGDTPLDPGQPPILRTDVVLPMSDGARSLGTVALRPGVTAEIQARIFVDETRTPDSCGADKTAVAVYGFAHTAATWGPLAEALFAAPSAAICRVVAIDLPGHGTSDLPSGMPFGTLLLHDYATAVLGALDALAAEGIQPRALLAHSQGGMVVQLAQGRLVAAGSSLRKAYGIQEVTLLAPTMPDGIPWAFADNGTAAGLLSGLITADAERGPYVAIPDFLWPVLFFSRLDGTMVSTAPAAGDVGALGYNAPEPLFSALQLVGALPNLPTRPAVARGIFAAVHGSQLEVVAFENDQLVRPAEADVLFSHLTADRNGHKFSVVTGSSSVHDMFVSAPAEMLAQVRPPLP